MCERRTEDTGELVLGTLTVHREKDPGVVWIDGNPEYLSDGNDGRIHTDQIITRETL